MSTWISKVRTTGTGLRVGVKDSIDVRGFRTTIGCEAIAQHASVEMVDADCVRGFRTQGMEIIGKTNLHELCYGGTGINPWYGTPQNPLDARLIPGGSSSGSAVAVGSGEADLALGTDTGGSIRVPAACCGVVGLKTRWGRVSLAGTRALAPSLDTVGPLARDVAGIIRGMECLVPGFTPAGAVSTVGRLRLPDVDRWVERAIDEALSRADLGSEDVDLNGWQPAHRAFETIVRYEAWAEWSSLVEEHEAKIGPKVVQRLREGEGVSTAHLQRAFAAQERWRGELAEVFEKRFAVLVLPTIPSSPPTLDTAAHDSGGGGAAPLSSLTRPFNVAGVPALSMPIPSGNHLPTSIQLVAESEEMLCAVASKLEAACVG